MNSDTLINKIKRLFSRRTVLIRGYQENVLDEYQNAWDVSLPINNKNLRSCEQKLIKLDKKELEYLLNQHFSNHTDYCKFGYFGIDLFGLNCNCFGIKEIHEHLICVLLHLIHVFCISGQDDKIKLVQVILNELLQMLAKGEIYPVFERYLSQQLKVKSSLTEIDLLAGQIDPQHEFLLKLCYWNILCAKNNNQGCEEFLKKNADFLVSNIEEIVNPGSSLHFLCNWKICRIHFVMPIFANILMCLLNLREHTVKMLIQYKDHIKELLISLLAIMLTKLPTSQINDAFSLCNVTPSNTTIQLELAKTFLDISLNPKISKHRKSIIADSIQPLLISHDFSKTVLPPTTDITNYACHKLDHKRMINISINIVKTKGKDINISMYEGLFCSEKKAIEHEVEMVKRSQKTETLVLLMLLLITITSTGHHKSAKLKKYLTLKYEYHMASLYLLWCSGDIEVHPGPSLNKKTLAHDSTIERRWIQNLSPKMINRLPVHEQSKFKPTKKVKKDREIREHFKSLLKKCLEEKVHVPKMYLAEIHAWETMEYHLLYKLFVYRCEIDIIIASIKDFLKYEGSTKVITNINVSLITELQTNEIVRVLENYTGLEDKSQTMVKTIRKIAGISNTCARGKDPAAKWDGIWDLPLKNWPSDIMLFDPNNRGKYKKRNPGRTLVSDKELVDTFLSLPQITFPQKYKDMVDAYKLMRKNENKQHKDIFCGIFKRTTSIEKTDFALKNLCKNGIFTEEVHNILQKWWNMEIVETNDDEILLRVNGETEKEGRPHILINISTKFVTLTVKHTSTNGSQLVYDFPFNDELVPLKTMATTVGQTTIQKPSSNFYQKVTAKKYLTVSPKPDECPAANQVNLIIIPPEALTVLNTYFPCEIYPNSQAILESNIKHQHKISSRETTLCSTIDFNQPTSSKKQISQLNHNIAISEQPGPILCTPNQSTTNSDDISSATKDSQNPDFHMQVSPTSDRGSSDSISSVNSESENEERDQNNTSNGGQDQLTDSDYSSDSSSNCVSKTSLKKRKCIEEDRIDVKKRKIPLLKQDKKQSETTSHRKIDSSMDNSTTCNKDMELLLDYLDIDLDSFDIDDQTFEVEMNALDNEDKNLQVCDKDRNLMNDEIQMSNKNTTVSAYDTNVSSDLEMFLQEMICGESEKMIQMKSYLSDV